MAQHADTVNHCPRPPLSRDWGPRDRGTALSEQKTRRKFNVGRDCGLASKNLVSGRRIHVEARRLELFQSAPSSSTQIFTVLDGVTMNASSEMKSRQRTNSAARYIRYSRKWFMARAPFPDFGLRDFNSHAKLVGINRMGHHINVRRNRRPCRRPRSPRPRCIRRGRRRRSVR